MGQSVLLYFYNALVQTKLLILFLCDFKEATFREVASFLLPEKNFRQKFYSYKYMVVLHYR